MKGLIQEATTGRALLGGGSFLWSPGHRQLGNLFPILMVYYFYFYIEVFKNVKPVNKV